MAEKFTQGELYQDDIYKNLRESLQKTLKVLQESDAAIKKQSKDLAEYAAKTDTTAKGVAQLTEANRKSKKALNEQEAITRKILKAEDELVRVTDLERKTLASLNLEKRKLNQAAKEQAIVESRVTTAYEKEQVALQKAQRRLKDLILTQGKAAPATRKMAKEVQRLDQRLRKADAAAGQFQRNVGNYRSALRGAVGGLKQFAGALGLVGGLQLFVRTLRDAFNVVKNFDQAQANLASVLGVSRDSMGNLTAQAKELGATTKFTASQVAELQLEFAKLGFTQEQIEGVTEGTLQLASAAGTDLGNAAAITGATIRGFGLDVSETQRVVDVMAKSFSASSLDIEKFKVGMAAVAPAAATAGFSIERTTALLGTLTNAGIDASTAGTGLRNIFLELTKKGITFEEAMNQIATASDQNAAALDLFGKRGATLGVILANNQSGVDSLTTSLENSGGAAQEMADKQLDTLGGSLDILRSAWEGVILEMNEGTGAGEGLKEMILALAEALPHIVRAISFLIKGLSGMFTGTFKNIKAISDLTSKIQNGTASFKDFGTAISNIGKNLLNMIPFMGQFIDQLREVGIEYGLIKSNIRQLTDEQRKNNAVREKSIEIGNELIKNNSDELGDIAILIDAIQDENTTREEKQEIMQKLNEDYPDVIKNIDLETASTEQLIQVKKEMIKQLFEQAIAQKKAEVQAEITGQILELELQKIGKNANGVAFLNSKIEELTNGLMIVDEVEQNVRDNLSSVVDGMNLESPLGKTSNAITELKNEIKGLEEAVKTAEGEELANLQKRLDKKREELRRFEQDRKKIIDDGLDKVNKSEELESEKSGKKKSKKEIDAEKAKLDRLAALKKKHNEELLRLENELIEQGVDRELIDEMIAERRLEQFREQGSLIKELDFKDTSILVKHRNDYLHLVEKGEIERVDLHAEANHEIEKLNNDFIKKLEDNSKKQSDLFKKSFQRVSELAKDAADFRIKQLEREQEASMDMINRSRSEQQRLIELGTTESAEALAAEVKREAREKKKIADLEKRKKNLLLFVVGLERANQLIQSGEIDPFGKTSADMSKFLNTLGNENPSALLSGIPGFFEGTTTTVMDALGAPNLNTSKDNYLTRLHGTEAVLNGDQYASITRANGYKLTTDEITRRAIMHTNRPSYRLNAVQNNNKDVIDSNKKVIEAIEELPKKMPVQWVDPEKMISTIQKGNKIDVTHHKKGFKFG